MVTQAFKRKELVGGLTNPFEKYHIVKFHHFPKDRGEKTYLKPRPRRSSWMESWCTSSMAGRRASLWSITDLNSNISPACASFRLFTVIDTTDKKKRNWWVVNFSMIQCLGPSGKPMTQLIILEYGSKNVRQGFVNFTIHLSAACCGNWGEENFLLGNCVIQDLK